MQQAELTHTIDMQAVLLLQSQQYQARSVHDLLLDNVVSRHCTSQYEEDDRPL